MKRIITAICFALLVTGMSAQSLVQHQLTMWTTGQHMLWDSTMIRYYGFGNGFLVAPQFPAPILYANEGDSVVLNIRNQSQGAGHTVHLHGLDVNQANDGVPHLSFTIHHEQDTAYYFRAPHPGTYLYHCHVASVLHVQMGMYGNVVIRPADGSNRAWTGGPAFDQEKIWLISEFDRSWHDTIPVHNTLDSVHAVFPLPEFRPDYFMVNGKSHQRLATPNTQIEARREEKVYLRISNVGFFYNRIIFPAGLNAEIIASDGRPLPNALNEDTLEVAPGERYGIMLEATTEFSDSVTVQFVNMNTDSVWNVQQVPVEIRGHIGVEKPDISPIQLTVSPNPAQDWAYLNWSLPKAGAATISVLDVNGRTVIQSEEFLTIRGGKSLSLAGLAPGIYWVELVQEEMRGTTKLIIGH